MNRFRKKYKKLGKRRIKTIKKKDVLNIFTINKTSILKDESMIKKYTVKIGRGKNNKYFIKVIVITIDNNQIDYTIVRKYGGKK